MLERSGFFAGFTLSQIDVGEATLRVRHGGSGPPLLLLHGHPRTHTTWHRVAPLLSDRFTVVCPDLRGYGESSKPPSDENHTPYSKRAMARDGVALMKELGFERFAVGGHDRGCYVAYRMALDHPTAVRALIVMDGIPIGEALQRCDARFAESWYHWFFLAQPAPVPERVILADPDWWYGGESAKMGLEAFRDVRRAQHDAETIHAMCEDYRAGLGVDRKNDDTDRALGRQIACPTLFLQSEFDDLKKLYKDPLEIWRSWAPNLTGKEIASHHHMAEEAPTELATAIKTFLTRNPSE